MANLQQTKTQPGCKKNSKRLSNLEKSLSNMYKNRSAIEYHNVWYRYPTNSEWALQGVTFSVPEASFCIITGPTGSGKTTLLALTRRLLIDSGEFEGKIIFGSTKKDIREVDTYSLGSYIALLFQDPNLQLHQLSVIEELRSAPMYQGLNWKECQRRAVGAAKGLVEEPLFTKSPTELSLGQQQRVAIAASLAMEAKILLFDEPLSYLDSKSKKEFIALLKELKRKGLTIVISTHRYDELIEMCDHFVLLDRGKVVTSGSPKQILYSPELAKTVGLPLFAETSTRLYEEGLIRFQPLGWKELISMFNLPSFLTRSTSGNFESMAPKEQTTLKAKNLRCIYRNGTVGLNDFSLAAKEGEVVGMIGPNGGGKTTFAKCLLGFLKKYSGELKVLGKERRKIDSQIMARIVGYVSQSPNETLFETTVFKEVLFGPKLLKLSQPSDRVENILEKLWLLPYREKHPRALSGGQQRLLTIANALVNDPKILILDEPEFGLDLKTWRKLETLIVNIKEKPISIILITHDLENTLFLNDKIALVNQGRTIKVGKPQEIYENIKLLQDNGLESPSFVPLLLRVIPFMQSWSKQSFIEAVVTFLKKMQKTKISHV